MGTAIVPALLWDVQEEHLNEAEFSCEAWNAALDSPVFSLHELRRGPEERLMANIMGLVIGGQPVCGVRSLNCGRHQHQSFQRFDMHVSVARKLCGHSLALSGKCELRQ